MPGPVPEMLAAASETRCECGQLIAKVRGQGLELKCKRCKRIVVIPFSSIEGWSTVQFPARR
jgi:phage FluMu protein Com